MNVNAAPRRRPWYIWPNLLSLDAPAVVLAWQDIFARCLHVPLGPIPRAVTAGSVWLAYAGDRLLDSRRIEPESLVTPRHRFAGSNFCPLAAVWLVALPATASAAFGLMSRELVEGGSALSALVLAYFLRIHWPARARLPWAFKEASVAALFCAGTLVFVVAKAGRLAPGAIPPIALWFLLCFLNCVGIGYWERDLDLVQGQTSFALQAPGSARHFGWAALTVGASSFAAGLCARRSDFTAIYFCGGLSAVLLAGLDRLSSGLAPDAKRAAADAVLLTPLLFLSLGGT